jgi:rod shape determining protein RodA
MKLIQNYIKATDKLLISLLLAISTISIIIMFSMYYNGFILSFDKIIVQIIATIIGVSLMVSISLVDYIVLARFWKVHMPFALLLVFLTFTSMGIQVEGTDDRAWLNIFGVTQLQPSELLKISFVLTLSLHIKSIGDDINKPKNILLLLLHSSVPIGVVFLQGDYGSAIVFCFIFAVMVFIGGISWKYILSSLIILPAVFAIFWFFILQPFHRTRFLISFNPELDPLNMGFQQMQGKIALGSGQLFGRGIIQKDLIGVPEMRNDFIFSYIGQTTGLVGCLVVLAILTLICLKIIFIAKMSNDTLGRNISIGIFSIIIFQTLINIGMVLNFIPVIGITLPFLSSGGTSVVTMYIALGVVLSVYIKNKKFIFRER